RHYTWMAATLASHSCYRREGSLNEGKGKQGYDLCFSRSISLHTFNKIERSIWSPPNSQHFRVRNEMQQNTSLPRLRANGRAVKMVPINEVVKKRAVSANKVENINGKKQVINGANVVKRSPSPPLVKRTNVTDSKKLPPIEGLKVLPSDEGFSWANENYNSFQRSIDVWSFIISLRVRVFLENTKWTYAGGFEDKQKKRRKKTASWLRERVLQLGPTFIKLGQLSSTRSDLFPREYVDELAKLQDKVPAFSPKKARGFIESELGAPIDTLFKEFEDRPIAAASLGQVHRAILHNGERVIVKVQRPGLKKLFDIDLRNLKLIAEYFQRSETFGGASRDWIGIYEECATILYQEIDYINEGKNADRFRRDFRNIKWVRVPLVFWDYTALKVLTLEYVPGVKINQLHVLDSRGFNRSRISSHAIEAYLIQILKTGFFHADPHPGNLAIDVDEAIIYYDFGYAKAHRSRSTSADRRHVIGEEIHSILLGQSIEPVTRPAADSSSNRRGTRTFGLANAKCLVLSHFVSSFINSSMGVWQDLFAIAQDQPFRFPSTFTFVLRAFSTLEGIGYMLDPDFSFVKIAAPYAQELLELKKERSGTQLVQEIRKQANDARTSTISMPYRVQKIEEFVQQLESGDLKLRVRVLESERAARKATVLQMTTMYTVMGGTLLNLGITLISQGNQAVAGGSFVGAGVFMVLVVRGIRRVKWLDKLEKMI
ncbi:hypothetical protein SDJN02_27582, partial [Cucurbita argyrosperma subsp. argyrosperma]